MLLLSYISFLCLFQKVLCRYIYGGMRSPKPAISNGKYEESRDPYTPKAQISLAGRNKEGMSQNSHGP